MAQKYFRFFGSQNIHCSILSPQLNKIVLFLINVIVNYYVHSRSSDGLLLVISSTDGFCSFVSFEAGELGKPWENKASKDNLEANTATVNQ